MGIAFAVVGTAGSALMIIAFLIMLIFAALFVYLFFRAARRLRATGLYKEGNKEIVKARQYCTRMALTCLGIITALVIGFAVLVYFGAFALAESFGNASSGTVLAVFFLIINIALFAGWLALLVFAVRARRFIRNNPNYKEGNKDWENLSAAVSSLSTVIISCIIAIVLVVIAFFIAIFAWWKARSIHHKDPVKTPYWNPQPVQRVDYRGSGPLPENAFMTRAANAVQNYFTPAPIAVIPFEPAVKPSPDAVRSNTLESGYYSPRTGEIYTKALPQTVSVWKYNDGTWRDSDGVYTGRIMSVR